MITPIGTEVFNGFKVKLPEFAVITPQRKQTFTVRTMKIEDEQNLKGSILTPNTVPEHLAQVLWNCIVKKPDDIKTYDDFIHKVTLRDRDAILYGLYVATYKDTQNYEMTCSGCGNINKVKVDMEKGFSANIYPNEDDILNFKKKIDLQIFEGVSFYLKVPTISDEIELSQHSLQLNSEDSALATDLLMIEKFEVSSNEQNPEVEVIKDRDNILKGYKELAPLDRKLITTTYRDFYDQYKIEVNCTSKCKCGQEDKHNIDITRQFFLSLYE